MAGFGASALASGAALAPWPARAADMVLAQQPARFALTGPVTEGMLSYAPDAAPPVLWLDQGQRFVADLENRSDQESTIHWHGIRLPAAMDGVPYLSQDPTAPGATFRYDFAPPDAGSFWYHPHCNTLDQMARGLTGVLVVRDSVDPGFDVDLPVNLRDFRLGHDGQFIEFFKLRNAARGGTLGTVITANWQQEPVHALPAGGLVRLRLVATDTTRVYKIKVAGLEGGAAAVVIALDGNPVPGAPFALNPGDPLLLGPGQRADLAVRMPDGEGQEILVTTLALGKDAPLLRLRATGASLGRDLRDLGPLSANPITQPDVANADVIPFVFGWSPGGDAPVNSSICGSLGATFWSINRTAWPGDFPNPLEPLARMRLGKTYILRFQNETQNDHPVHLHGMSFRLIRSNKRELSPLWTDTALLRAQETIDVAVVADNPGDWMFHCHVIEHQKTGLSGFIRVD
jgi:FtsP/CotA-like multicopper oxidase with cupredoxin domain